MNITEKILARASGKEKLEPGDVVFALRRLKNWKKMEY
ncbi:hypothetical protein AAA799D07_00511 [Marine Group I thaumarchaeote SCGC AAA799-D07]|nr:hypothetical protein AAA799D07_00511 [Marine Group I thaumarchaeote SCGC AAA799-D07]